MKVVYYGRSTRTARFSQPRGQGDIIELLMDNWDDFGFKTTFGTICRINGDSVELGYIKVMVDGYDVTSNYLDQLRRDGWNGEFPLPSGVYLSLPSEITFYEQIASRTDLDGARLIAELLRDASYLVNVLVDTKAIELVEAAIFQKSLQRERGEVKSFIDGWKIFERKETNIDDINFKFNDVANKIADIELRFGTHGLLPRDINVLIGPNGVGKSQLLHQIVRDWLDEFDENREVGFTKKPNLSQIVVVSYSPFENFPVDLRGMPKQDQDIYRYFGFRGRSVSNSSAKQLGRIRLTHEAPKRNAAASLVDALSDDKRYHGMEGWPQKLKTMENILKTSFDFDVAAVAIKIDDFNLDHYVKDDIWGEEILFSGSADSKGKFLIGIGSGHIDSLEVENIRKDLIASEGVSFIKDGSPIKLSSGQKLFSFMVINILGAIRKDSLILIDEPELFLHPTLEICFIGMLKGILQHFKSKALMATHSVVTVREVPSECVHVFVRNEKRVTIKQPPFQTFGGDVQRITSYVFGDSATSKPFEEWIANKLKEKGGADALIDSLGQDINEELAIQIRAMDTDDWEHGAW